MIRGRAITVQGSGKDEKEPWVTWSVKTIWEDKA
jgi:hypothetical protein